MTSTYLSTLFSLASKTALVTGGTRGIGAGLAVALASAGADIVLAARAPSRASATQEKVRALGRRCDVYVCDLAEPSSVAGLLPAVLAGSGGAAPDILVNCAGTHQRKPAVGYSDADAARIWQVNVAAMFSLSRALGAHWLRAGQRGKIVNVASILSFVGGSELAAYAATKGAIAQLTKTLSNEWAASGINVNAIAPGYVVTDLTKDLRENPEKNADILKRTPAGRWGVPEDLAGAVVWLAGEGSNWVCGSVVPVDGGYLAR